MGFLTLTSAIIAAAVTIPALVSLYFLKLKRRRMLVSTTMLWKKTIHEMQVNSPFQRLRRNLLLLLQLLLLIAMLFAFARPHTSGIAIPGQRTILVIDHSGSMNATDVSPTRLDAAKQRALDIIEQTDFGEENEGGMMIVSFARQARVMQPFTKDRSLLRRAIRQIEPTDQSSELATALALIEPFAAEAASTGGDAVTVRLLTDGKVNIPESRGLSLEGAELEFMRVGGEAGVAKDNLAIVSASGRRDFDKPQIVQIFATVANFGPEAVETNLTLTVDGRVQRINRINLGPATDGPFTRSVQFDLVAPGSAMVNLSLDHEDLLLADNAVNLLLAPSRRLRVLLVTEGNAFLDRVIRSTGVRELVTMTPKKFENQGEAALRRGDWEELSRGGGASGGGFDVIVFDSYSPKRVPPVSSLYFGCAPPIPGLEIKPPRDDEDAAQYILDWPRDHPLMRWVVLDDVILSKPGRLVVPASATVLATGQSGPIIAEMQYDRERHVVTSFNVLGSNWPLYISFPVFMGNALQTLGRVDSTVIAYRAGDIAAIPVGRDQLTLHYTGPSSLKSHISMNQAVLPAFPRVGLYESDETMPQPYDRLPVNMLDLSESDLSPAERIEVGTSRVEGTAQATQVRYEIWRYFVWGALVLLLLEWLVYTRRMHL